jgi:uncharacterized membrane protein YqaE (UPF0057 family)
MFGVVARGSVGGHGDLQLALAVLMAAAGIYLRTGTMSAALAGTGAAAVTVGVGVSMFLVAHVYIPGTIVAIFAMFRLADLIGRLRRQAAAAPSSVDASSCAPPAQASTDYWGR